jgi:protein-tyrosine phosphatase
MSAFSVLFVCMGNICRSPTAHAVFRNRDRDEGLADVVAVDSAGTYNYHPNSPPDERSQALLGLFDAASFWREKILNGFD